MSRKRYKPEIATSAIWKGTVRLCRATLAPILMSLFCISITLRQNSTSQQNQWLTKPNPDLLFNLGLIASGKAGGRATMKAFASMSR
jgi:hypothetical protein